MRIITRNRDTLAGLFFTLLSFYLLYEIQNFALTGETIRSLGPHVLPNIYSVILCFLGICLFISGLRQPPQPLFDRSYASAAIIVPLAFLTGIIIFIICGTWLGFCLWSFLYLCAGMLVMKERNMVRGIFLNILITAIIFVIFATLLHVPLPRSVLGI